MGWGTSWGRVWGGGFEDDVAFELLSARASGSNSFTVTFSKQPLFVSPLNLGDASRLANWTLVRVDAAQTLTMLTVRPTSDPLTIEFVIIERWASKLAEYRITGAATLLAANAQQLITTPATADFFGTPEVLPVHEQRTDLIDISNPQNGINTLNGGLVVGTDGDYELESGMTLLKKLIWRRIFTAQGAFLHLADVPYGLGVEPKAFFRSVDLVAFRKQLKLEVQAEPEVIEAGVQVELFADGRLLIAIKARTRFGPLELEVPVAGLGEGVQF